MKLHEFYKLYANTPLGRRNVPINFKNTSDVLPKDEDHIKSLNEMFIRLKELELVMHPYRMEEERILRLAELLQCHSTQTLGKTRPKFTMKDNTRSQRQMLNAFYEDEHREFDPF